MFVVEFIFQVMLNDFAVYETSFVTNNRLQRRNRKLHQP